MIAAFCGSIFLLFLVAPIAKLIGAGGVSGVQQLFTDHELRMSLALTAVTATAATALAILGGTPLAYLLERRRFRGRAALAALIDLPLLIPHPVAGIALLLV
ncbi:MAG: molybdate ABC transporter permease subunit, partial [Gemmatimonadaceae bacterium]